MKRRIEQKFRKVFTFIMSVIMVVETVNCVSLTALASEGSVSAGDAITLNKELSEQVSSAERAAIAADEAAKAAEAALKAAQQLSDEAADAALKTAPDGTYTETVSDSDGNSVKVPVLKDELDDAITDAENKVQDANNSNQDMIDETQNKIDYLAEKAVDDTDAQLKIAEDAADDAAAAATKAQDELKKAIDAKDYYTAQKAAEAASNAYKEAQKAADAAGKAYEAAQIILDDAKNAVIIAIEACDATTGDAINTAQKAIEDAQAALDAAKEIVDKAEIAYAAAKANLDAAKVAAVKAAETVEAIADGIVGDLETAKGADVDQLAEDKAAAEEALKKAEADKNLIDAQQDDIIKKATEDKAAADAKIVEYNNAEKFVDQLEDDGYFGWKTSEIDKLKEVASKTTSDVKDYEYVRSGRGYKKVPIYYTQSEIDEAIAKVAAYNAAKDLIDNTDIHAVKQASVDAQNQINKANIAKNEAANAVTNKKNEVASLEATIKTITDYIYNNSSAVVYELDKDDTYKKLLAELKASIAQYDKSVKTREEYQDATNRDWKNVLESLEKLLKELNIEFKNNGDYFDWRTLSINTEYGKLTIFGNNNENVTTLINIENGKLTVAKVDELEFATYAATFDAVAAAESAARAADAAVKEQEAKEKLEDAKKALQIAQERLDALKLKKMNLDKALDDLAKAKANVALTEKEWDAAKASAEKAMKAAEEAKTVPETKPVKTAFYVLNRGMSQPSEVKSYPKENYSKPGISGELYSGVLDEATGTRDYSFVSLYKKGIRDEALVPQYLKVVPTTQQLAASGVVLKEGESIKWYVIKTEGDGYHVDGFIVNQRFNINVLYGYKDSEDQFVEFTKDDGSTYAQSGTFVLGDTYEFVSPVIDEYIAETSIVTGVASADMTIEVVYTEEEVAPVIINYYRGSLAGTLLKSVPLNVAVSKLAGYDTTISANWLNTAKPTDCNNGVLVNYYYSETEEAWVANIVYSVIPFEEPPTPPAPTPVVEVVPVITVNEESTPTTVRTIATTTSTPVVDDEEEDVVEVEEEETPLADAPEEEKETTDEVQDVVNIEEEETPLAAGGNCWIHWLILLITAAYTLYELVRCVARNKKIKELSDSNQSVEA